MILNVVNLNIHKRVKLLVVLVAGFWVVQLPLGQLAQLSLVYQQVVLAFFWCAVVAGAGGGYAGGKYGGEYGESKGEVLYKANGIR